MGGAKFELPILVDHPLTSCVSPPVIGYGQYSSLDIGTFETLTELKFMVMGDT